MVKRWDFDRTIRCSSFVVPEGAGEYYFTVISDKPGSFDEAVAELCEKYRYVTEYMGLSQRTLVFSRLYVGDIANHRGLLVKSELFRHIGHGVVSVIEQPPPAPGSLALFSYHLKKTAGDFQKEFSGWVREPWCTEMVVKGDHYSMVWKSNLTQEGPPDPKQQTGRLFKSFSALLHRYNLNVRNNLVRTWMYVRDIDNNYAGMVEARKDFFHSQGLCSESRFVASTGIEGRSGVDGAVIAMDSLSLGNIDEEQIIRIEALECLPRTISYGVTFERGLRLRFGDRSHLLISGTASINADGKVAYEGDVEKQTHKTIDNVEALLRTQGATLNDMAYVFCYMRNPVDYERVKEIVDARLPGNIPLVSVRAAVCRPAWLFEMEGTAIIADSSPFPAFI